MVFSFLPLERKNYVYEPVFQQHYENGDQTVSYLILNTISVNVFQNGYYFIDHFYATPNSIFSVRHGFKLQGLLFISTYVRNVFYTFISIHAP
ncbi:MAG: hypothetical protein M3512_03740 [Bacteroidota bacterium]|nr:hypothetical protein [Bacteroidota bacterium]